MNNRSIFIRFIFLMGFFLLSRVGFAQLTIAPTNLFIDGQNKFGTYMVINNSVQPQEVTVDFYFGYMKNDSFGSREMIRNEAAKAQENHSIANQIRAFPQSFILAPGQRQIVRIRVAAGNDLPDGTYWARISTTSSAEARPVEAAAEQSVAAQVGIKIEQVTGLFYKKGTTTTGIEPGQIRAVSENGTLNVFTDFEQTGNSPFLGTITTTLQNAGGDIVAEDRLSTSLYFDGTHKATLDINDIPAGTYTVKVLFESQRNDISSSDLVQMKPVTKTITYVVR